MDDTDSDDAPAVASVALDHAGEVLIGQHMSDLKALGPWTAQGRSKPSAAVASTTTGGCRPACR
jgi:hypothetical protein